MLCYDVIIQPSLIKSERKKKEKNIVWNVPKFKDLLDINATDAGRTLL